MQADKESGEVHDVFSVVRQLVPGETCLWCNELVDATRLAEEAASPEQCEAQRYIDEIPAPSVITLNAVATAHVVCPGYRAVGIVESRECRPRGGHHG